MAFPLKEHLFIRNEAPTKIKNIFGENVHLENQFTGEITTHPFKALLDEYAQGLLYAVPRKKHEVPLPKLAGNEVESMGRLSEAARVETRRRIDYIVKLNAMDAFGKDRKTLWQAILEISQSRGEKRPPDISTVYRWRGKFLQMQQDIHALFSRFDVRGGKGKSRLDQEVEAVIHQKIEKILSESRSWCAEDVYNAVLLEIQLLNTVRIESEWLEVPGLRTIQRRMGEISRYDLSVARYGLKEAERRLARCEGARRVFRILELVEIDHTPIDIIVVNEKRIAIGRPTITLVLDRYSRCVLGFHLSLAGHGTPTVFEAIRHSLLPKTYLKSRYPNDDFNWDCYGWMERIVMDNGREFHAEAVTDALISLGIVVEYAASRDPNDKPFVERFIKTLNYSFIHTLPGTTFAKREQRIGFVAEDEACLTLEELDRAIHAWITQIYHLRPHSSLDGRAPIDVWNESAREFPPQLKANAEDIEIEFSDVCKSSVQHYGIDLNNFCYYSERLRQLHRLLPPKVKVDVKWPRNNIGHIFVWDPFEKEYFEVPNRDESYAGLTLEQAKAVRKKHKDSPEYKETRAKASDMVREMAREANEDKNLKNRRKGARLANKSSAELHREPKPPKPTKPVASRANRQSITSDGPVQGFASEMLDTEAI